MIDDCDVQIPFPRVAKCHGYCGYIRVKKLAGWGKKSGRTHSFAKSSIVLGKFDQLISRFETFIVKLN